MRLEDVVDAYLKSWLRDLPPRHKGKDWLRRRLRKPHVTLDTATAFYNVISLETDKLPWDAADLLLGVLNEKRRVARGTARRCLIDAHYEYLPKAVNQGKLSEHAIVNRALKKSLLRANDTTATMCFLLNSHLLLKPRICVSAQTREVSGSAIRNVMTTSSNSACFTSGIPPSFISDRTYVTNIPQRHDALIVERIEAGACQLDALLVQNPSRISATTASRLSSAAAGCAIQTMLAMSTALTVFCTLSSRYSGLCRRGS